MKEKKKKITHLTRSVVLLIVSYIYRNLSAYLHDVVMTDDKSNTYLPIKFGFKR